MESKFTKEQIDNILFQLNYPKEIYTETDIKFDGHPEKNKMCYIVTKNWDNTKFPHVYYGIYYGENKWSKGEVFRGLVNEVYISENAILAYIQIKD